jgi:hypothetical protein
VSLAVVTQKKIHHDIGRKQVELGAMRIEIVSVTHNPPHRIRQNWLGIPAMKDRDVVTLGD